MKTLSSIIGMSFLIPSLAFAQTPFAKEPFTDVSVSHSNHEAIEYLRENNVLRGYLDGTFKPDRRISRAEFVKLITNPFVLDTVRMSECMATNYKDTSVSIFPDTPRDAWYINELCHAKDSRLVDGYPDGKFRPNDYINVAEASKILSSAFRFEIKNEDQGQRWYVPYVNRLGELHAIPTTVTSLSAPLTRGDMAEMLYRLKANRTNKTFRTSASLKQ